MWESKGFVMNSSYRTNHRQVKEKQESLGMGAVLSEDRGRACSRMGQTAQGLRLAEAVSSRFREAPCLTKQDGEREGQIRLWLLHVHTQVSTPAFTTDTGWGGGACERTGCCVSSSVTPGVFT